MSLGRHILSLTTGNVASQVIGLITMPIITRLYSADDYGVFSVFLALTAMLAPIACLQYEVAITLPRARATALVVQRLSGLVLVAFCLLVGIVELGVDILIRLGWVNTGLLPNQHLAMFWWLLPVALFVQGLMTISSSWLIREKNFSRASWGRISEVLIDRTAAVLMGLFAATPLALVVARVGGWAAAAFTMRRRNTKVAVSVHEPAPTLREVAIRYKSLPLFSTWAVLMGTVARESPLIVLGLFFSPAVAGFYGLGMRVVNLPAQVIGDAIGRAFFQRAAELHAGMESIARHSCTILKFGLYAAIPPAVVLAALAPELFALVFGNKWREAGVYAQILVPMFVILFIQRPAWGLFDVFDKQREKLVINTLTVIGRLGPVILGAVLRWELHTTLIVMSFSTTVVYGFGMMMVMRHAGVTSGMIRETIMHAGKRLVPCMIVALILYWIGITGWAALIAGTLVILGQYVLVWFHEPQIRSVVRR
jgi:O-antigen/teichoic acid export membrane protein